MKRIEISIDSQAGRTVCVLAEQLNLDAHDVLQGILFGLCNRKTQGKGRAERVRLPE